MDSRYYIFGAHSRGRTLFEYLKTLYPGDEMLGFLFDNDEPNLAEADGFPVIDLKCCMAPRKYPGDGGLDTEAVVYIATHGDSHEGIIKRLTDIGFMDFKPVTPELDISLRNSYVEMKYREKGKVFTKITLNHSVPESGTDKDISNCIFIAKTPYDKDFSVQADLKDCEKIVQAGCALTDIRLKEASYFDDRGENISSRNSQFSEMTALYWIWKHLKSDYIGLEHWRRRFILPKDWAGIMEREGIDVILPVPLCVMPSLEENYKERHLSFIWDEAMKIMGEMYPDDHERASDYFAGNSLYSPCNMMIARYDVLDDYCSWIFPMLIELNDRVENVEDKYQNRYPGFVSERFLTYFFEANREKYNVAYADKIFLR